MSKLPDRGFRLRTRSRTNDKLPKYRIIRPYRHYVVGAVIQPPAAAGQVLMGQGVAEKVETEDANEENTVPVKKKRGRPRKVQLNGD